MIYKIIKSISLKKLKKNDKIKNCRYCENKRNWHAVKDKPEKSFNPCSYG